MSGNLYEWCWDMLPGGGVTTTTTASTLITGFTLEEVIAASEAAGKTTVTYCHYECGGNYKASDVTWCNVWRHSLDAALNRSELVGFRIVHNAN